MRPLSILHLTAPGEVGGLESVVRTLAVGHAARGHRVGVFASVTGENTDTPFTRALQSGGVEVHVPPLATRSYLRERAAIRQVVDATNPDIVHSHGYRADVVGLFATGGRVRRVTTVHGFTGGDWKNRMYERLQLRALRKFDVVVSVSRPLLDRIIASGVPEPRVRLIPNAFGSAGTPIDRSTAREALRFPGNEFVIGWVGRLGREKGLDLMLEALQLLVDLPVALAVLGDGQERQSLEAQARSLGVFDRVRWLGIVPEAGRYFSAFDLYVLSSRTEGTPVTVLEAMDARVPVVATAVGGVPDVLSEREAWLVPAGNPGRLAAAIRHAWSDEAERLSRAETASRRLARDFALSPWLESYERLYRTLITPGRNG